MGIGAWNTTQVRLLQARPCLACSHPQGDFPDFSSTEPCRKRVGLTTYNSLDQKKSTPDITKKVLQELPTKPVNTEEKTFRDYKTVVKVIENTFLGDTEDKMCGACVYVNYTRPTENPVTLTNWYHSLRSTPLITCIPHSLQPTVP